MSSTFRFRFILREFGVKKIWNAWSRSFLFNTVVKRCKRERGVISVLQCFRQTLLRPKRTLMLSVAACKGRSDDEAPASCFIDISDEQMQDLVVDFEGVEALAKKTLFCDKCGKRLVIEKKYPGIVYCSCTSRPEILSSDGWVPYIEAEDVIVWRKEYKPGQGHYIYKAYGRYKEVIAYDFAAIQLDGAYRSKWDNSVASISMVERQANGVKDQAVLYWEVLWPRFFANRDYVYMRRYKEFDVHRKCMSHKDGIFVGENPCSKTEAHPEVYDEGEDPCSKTEGAPKYHEDRPNVHSRAKRKAWEKEMNKQTEKEKEEKEAENDNKAYVIVSQSCKHPNVPESKHTIRVLEYWSHMVVQTLNGEDKPGTEFVLTYYDVPAAGGMPSGVASWASGRAIPVFLDRMRIAARKYRAWLSSDTEHDIPDFMPDKPEKVSHDEDAPRTEVREQDMETFKQGPEISEPDDEATKDQGTQTDSEKPSNDETMVPGDDINTKKSDAPIPLREDCIQAVVSEKTEDDDEKRSYWRYLYPLYYFV